MAYKINDDCISCGACEAECPNDAISEGETTYVIDPAKCTECVGSHTESKCLEVCPVEAPQPDEDNKETKDQLVEKWRNLHPGEEPVEGTY
jgi:ferredoxin